MHWKIQSRMTVYFVLVIIRTVRMVRYAPNQNCMYYYIMSTKLYMRDFTND